MDPEIRLIYSGGLRVDVVVLDEHGLAENVTAVVLRCDAGDDLVTGEKNSRGQSVLMIRRVECVDEMVKCQAIVMTGRRIPVSTATIGEGEVLRRD